MKFMCGPDGSWMFETVFGYKKRSESVRRQHSTRCGPDGKRNGGGGKNDEQGAKHDRTVLKRKANTPHSAIG